MIQTHKSFLEWVEAIQLKAEDPAKWSLESGPFYVDRTCKTDWAPEEAYGGEAIFAGVCHFQPQPAQVRLDYTMLNEINAEEPTAINDFKEYLHETFSCGNGSGRIDGYWHGFDGFRIKYSFIVGKDGETFNVLVGVSD